MNDRGHLAAVDLDALRLGILSADESREAKLHLEGCERCQVALRQIEEDAQTFDEVVLPRSLPRVRERLSKKRRWQPLWFGVPAAAVAAALILVWVVPPEEPDVTIKGGAGLRVVAKRGDAVFPVEPKVLLRQGDRIRFVVEPAGARFVMILSKDSGGEVTVYYPYDKTESAPLPPETRELPGSIALDDAPGPERIVAIFSERPLQVEHARQALADAADRPLQKDALAGAGEIVELQVDKE